jgi:hypothetical protein
MSGNNGVAAVVAAAANKAAPDFVRPQDIMLGFQHLSLISLSPSKTIFADVSG